MPGHRICLRISGPPNSTPIPSVRVYAARTIRKRVPRGVIVVTAGQLRYRLLEGNVEATLLTAPRCGVVEPTVVHEVEPLGEVSCYVEFYRWIDRPANVVHPCCSRC